MIKHQLQQPCSTLYTKKFGDHLNTVDPIDRHQVYHCLDTLYKIGDGLNGLEPRISNWIQDKFSVSSKTVNKVHKYMFIWYAIVAVLFHFWVLCLHCIVYYFTFLTSLDGWLIAFIAWLCNSCSTWSSTAKKILVKERNHNGTFSWRHMPVGFI